MNGLEYFPHYTSILTGTSHAAYLTCKHHQAHFTDTMPLEELWSIHSNTEKQLSSFHDENMLFNLKRTIAHRLITSCIQCERRCKTNRTLHPGVCKTQETHIASEFLHPGEERVLVPSHTIFFSGCPLNCDFCQNWDISQTTTGTTITPTSLAACITQRVRQGARNVNWVGGDPTPNLPYILDVLSHLTINIPQIWNSNMYCSIETMRLLTGIIDLYLTDFKFGNDRCAERLAHIDNYVAIVQRNHFLAAQTGDVLIRHLVLPNHSDCCSRPILDWLASNLPNAVVNLMSQYHPEYRSVKPRNKQQVSPMEYQKVVDYATSLGLYIL